MLISHKYKFIKIDIPKTGTKSYRAALKADFTDIIGLPYKMSVNSPKHSHDFLQHDTANQVKQKLKKQNLNWDDYFSFTIIRNPWDRYVSFLYYYIHTAKDYEDTIKNGVNIEEAWARPKINQGKSWYKKFKDFDMNDLNNLSFFLKHIISIKETQTKYLVDGSNNNIINYIGKFENFHSEYEFIINKLNLQGVPKLPHLNQYNINKLENKKIYTQELIDLVAEKERFIIEKYGYVY